ncbi:uncharacterized protein LOC117487876 isoform X5 [Trematomus bernacchii]|uniref:uncharacterized protein LOC117487876 isoform X5 n=1 Tax=Trematomus bernacchii TaxID=40690 RepID=UPI00146D0C4B|nr:uncharacterized protein LOC117487876 isoform X5 [Trematomus bernacchii]
MEAAVLSRSRAGGLFFLFTLLGLVCITTSLMDDNTLEKYKREVQELEQKREKRKAQGRGHRKESIKHFEVRHQIIPFIHHQYRRSPFTHITAMAAAVSSRSRGAAGGLFFLFTLLALVCTAASLMDENKLAQRDTDSELIKGRMEKLKSRMDGDNEELDANILKLEKDLRASKKIVQSQEEYHAEL